MTILPRIAVIGCGTIARRLHIPALQREGARLTVFAGRTLDTALAAAGDAGTGECTDDWRTVLTRDDVDGVVICTPNHLHADIAVAAAQSRKHVLVEKPMATSLADADRMIGAAAANRVWLVPAHNARTAAPFAAAAAAVRRGEIGAVTGIRAALGNRGPEDWARAAPQSGRPLAPTTTWFRDPERAGGGVLIDLGVHLADLVRAVTGDEIVRITCVTHRDATGVDDEAHVAFGLAGGACGSFHVSWRSRPAPDHQLTVVGTEATLHVDPRTPLTLLPGDGSAARTVPVGKVERDPVSIFVQAIAGGTPPEIDGADGRAALAAVLAAYAAEVAV